MISQRIIGVVLIYENICVQSIKFKKFLPIGRPEISVEYLNRFGIDEIVMLDITPAKNGKKTNFKSIQQACSYANTPIAVGGGLNNISDVRKIISTGADKVIFNTACHEKPELIEETAKLFGSQAVVASIDVESTKSEFEVYFKGGSVRSRFDLRSWINYVQDLGVGEIFVNSISRDGTKSGFDIDLVSYIEDYSNVPAIICGGAGEIDHFLDNKLRTISGIAAGNFFHFTEHSAIVLKKFLRDKISNIRLETYANYQNHNLGEDSRPTAIKESYLEKIRFTPIIEEII